MSREDRIAAQDAWRAARLCVALRAPPVFLDRRATTYGVFLGRPLSPDRLSEMIGTCQSPLGAARGILGWMMEPKSQVQADHQAHICQRRKGIESQMKQNAGLIADLARLRSFATKNPMNKDSGKTKKRRSWDDHKTATKHPWYGNYISNL